MSTMTRGIENVFTKKLAEVRLCQQEVVSFGKSLSLLGKNILGDPTFSMETPVYIPEQATFGYDLDSGVLNDFAGVVTRYINEAVVDERRSSIFDGRKPRSITELIDKWSDSYISDSVNYAKIYWKGLTEAVANGEERAKMFTRKVTVPITFEQAFPSIYAWQEAYPVIVKKKIKVVSDVYVKPPCAWPSLCGDALKILEAKLTTEQREIWDKDEHKRAKRSREMVDELGIFDRGINNMDVHLKWERTVQIRAFTGVYQHAPQYDCDL